MAKALILNDLVEQLGIKIYQLEQTIGASNGSIAKAIKGDKDITKNLIEKILKKYPTVSEQWLETGEGDIFLDTPLSSTEGDRIRKQKAFGERKNKGVAYVPIPAQAGYSKHFYEPVFRHNLQRYPYPLPYEGDRFMVFQVKGNSMEYYDSNNRPAGLFEGMDIVCEVVEGDDWKRGQIAPYHIYVIVKEDEIVVKRILIKDNGEYVMHSDNPDEKPRQRPLKKEDIKELWYVKRKVDWDMAPPERIEIEI